MLEDISQVIGFEAVVDSWDGASQQSVISHSLKLPTVLAHTSIDGRCSSYSKDRFQESRSVCAQDADALMSVLLQVIRKPSRAICRFLICSLQCPPICGFMMDCRGLFTSKSALVPALLPG